MVNRITRNRSFSITVRSKKGSKPSASISRPNTDGTSYFYTNNFPTEAGFGLNTAFGACPDSFLHLKRKDTKNIQSKNG